jgi:hypothetical protein
MFFWQRCLIPKPCHYERPIARPPSLIWPTYDNSCRKSEVLLLSESAFQFAEERTGWALSFGELDEAGHARELASLRQAKASFQACERDLPALKRAWKTVAERRDALPADDPKAVGARRRFVERLGRLDGLWLLPCFLAWGEHEAFSAEKALATQRDLLLATRVDERNAFLFCANLDYFSFNQRVAGVLRALAAVDRIDAACAQDILAHGRRMGALGLDGWCMDSGGYPLGDRDAGDGPRAFAQLEAIALAQEFRQQSGARSGPADATAEPSARGPSRRL